MGAWKRIPWLCEVPVLRTPAVLDMEYDSTWRSAYRVKVLGKSGHGSYSSTLDSSRMRRGIWPTVPLTHCGPFLGGFAGAGPNVSQLDVTWRFLSVRQAASGAPFAQLPSAMQTLAAGAANGITAEWVAPGTPN